MEPLLNHDYPVRIGASLYSAEAPALHTLFADFLAQSTDLSKLGFCKVESGSSQWQFQNSGGTISSTLSGAKQTNDETKECVLLFDGESFVLERVSYSHCFMNHEAGGSMPRNFIPHKDKPSSSVKRPRPSLSKIPASISSKRFKEGDRTPVQQVTKSNSFSGLSQSETTLSSTITSTPRAQPVERPAGKTLASLKQNLGKPPNKQPRQEPEVRRDVGGSPGQDLDDLNDLLEDINNLFSDISEGSQESPENDSSGFGLPDLLAPKPQASSLPSLMPMPTLRPQQTTPTQPPRSPQILSQPTQSARQQQEQHQEQQEQQQEQQQPQQPPQQPPPRQPDLQQFAGPGGRRFLPIPITAASNADDVSSSSSSGSSSSSDSDSSE
eukprot:TRINITY_DN4569_c0_g1_i1.p1 TRINITY_DN4569_c0_g1~~TRINITY_DN4569_c0_g1_i1.p1  ORF type:complete len:389 (-),score=69.02 TRINITY_DN4569_c0_g1_i1:49-1194(-)